MIIHARGTTACAAVWVGLGVGLSGCGGGGSDAGEIDDVADFARVAQEMGDAAGRAADQRVDPVDFRELKGLLPEEVIGWPRIEHEGERGGVAGLSVSTASALYRPQDGLYTTIDIEITDTGGLGGLAGMSMAAWLTMEVDRETDSGFERTTEYEGYPAYQMFHATRDADIGSAQLQFIVGQRFIVQVNGADVRMADVMSAAAELDLDELARLAPG